MTAKLDILCVEDDADILTIITMALDLDPEIACTTASSGEAAVALLAGPDAAPDVVLLDLRLPDMAGDDLLARMAANPATAAIAVILLTGDIPRGERHAAEDRAVRGIIRKPFDPLTLAAQIRQLLADGSGGGT